MYGPRVGKRDKTQEALDSLAQALTEPRSPAARKALLAALKRRSNLLVQAAAKAIERHELEGFEAPLVRAFTSALTRPTKSDPGCRAKLAIVRALDRLNARELDVLLAGVTHIQREPVWGGTVDTAAELRGACAMALVNAHYVDVLDALAVLLADPERAARLAAISAIAATGDARAGVPLLLLLLTRGDDSPEVLQTCCDALLSLAPERSFAFVRDQLMHDDTARAEAAALALGERRPPGSLDALREFAERRPLSRGVAALAIAMLRTDEAWGLLIEQFEDGDPAEARSALEALAVYKEQPGLRARLEAACEGLPARQRLLATIFADA